MSCVSVARVHIALRRETLFAEMSVAKIEYNICEENGQPKIGGLNDPRMVRGVGRATCRAWCNAHNDTGDELSER